MILISVIINKKINFFLLVHKLKKIFSSIFFAVRVMALNVNDKYQYTNNQLLSVSWNNFSQSYNLFILLKNISKYNRKRYGNEIMIAIFEDFVAIFSNKKYLNFRFKVKKMVWNFIGIYKNVNFNYKSFVLIYGLGSQEKQLTYVYKKAKGFIIITTPDCLCKIVVYVFRIINIRRYIHIWKYNVVYHGT